MKPELRRVVVLYYGFQFFFSLLLWLPIFYEYQKRLGLSDTQIFSIQSIYYTVFCFLEIPTGMLADLWGHRQCMIAGAMALVACNLLPIFLPNYDGFLYHFLLIALSRSFISGASAAYLYDFLVLHGSQSEYKQVEGNARAYGLIGKVACWAAVGALMEWHFTLPYWLTAVSAAVSVVFAWKLPSFVARAQGEKRGLNPFANISEIFSSLLASPRLFLIMLQGIAIFVLARICQVNLFQPILGAGGFGLAYYGMVMSAMTIFEAIGSMQPNLFRKRMNDLNAVFVLSFLMLLSLGLLPIANKLGTVLLLCVFAYATGLSFPVQKQLVNDAIPNSKFRATFMSVESIIDRGVCAVVASLIGGFLSRGRLNQFLVWSALATGIFMVVLAILFYANNSVPALRRENRERVL